MNMEQARIKAEIMKAMSHPIRIILVDALSKGDRCVCELQPLVGIDQSTLSRHLSQLKRAGIVSERKEGVKVIHHLETPCILKAFDCAEKVLQQRHARQAALM
jgi:DNA-binding transcriptional ArsR family regulator